MSLQQPLVIVAGKLQQLKSNTLAASDGLAKSLFSTSEPIYGFAGLTTTGIVVKSTSGSGVITTTITGTSGKIAVTNGDGLSGAPTLTIDSGYVGQSSITTLGTISSGTWNGSTVGVPYGGTGAVSFTSNTLLLGHGTAAVGSVATGTNGQILELVLGVPTWVNPSATGVTSVVGTTDRITVNSGTPSAPVVDIASTYV